MSKLTPKDDFLGSECSSQRIHGDPKSSKSKMCVCVCVCMHAHIHTRLCTT